MNPENPSCSSGAIDCAARAFSNVAAAARSLEHDDRAARQPMVGRAAAGVVEILMALPERVEQIGKTHDLDAGGRGQPLDPGVEHFRQVDIQHSVGTERRIHARLERRGADLGVTREIVGGIVRRAEDLHAEFREDAARRQFAGLQPLVRARPDALGRRLVEQVVDVEIAFQLEMGPVIQGVAQAPRHRGGPGLEFLVRLGVAGAEPFRDAVGAHRTPFVVIPLEPDLEQVPERAVARDVARREMIVIVEDRLWRGVLVVQTAGDLAVEQKSIVNERHRDTACYYETRCGSGVPSETVL